MHIDQLGRIVELVNGEKYFSCAGCVYYESKNPRCSGKMPLQADCTTLTIFKIVETTP